ncbi:MAG: carboxypeptidase regulatory-like domain-containing protein [Candidatus Zixiibacteriota bacterium]|nr:MAG: carboxypeptidase regulatory-like domain-containing protein [candidate division Zixibacteria bacterium]
MKKLLLLIILLLIFNFAGYSYGQNISLISIFDTPGEAHDVRLLGNYAFIADSGNGLSIVDVSDPLNPTLAGNCPTWGQHLSVAVESGYAYIAATHNLQIFDISDYSNPIPVGSLTTPEDAIDVFVERDYAYVCDRGNPFTSGLIIIDISDKTNPVISGSCGTNFIGGIYVRGDYAYIAADERGLDEEGFKVIDVLDRSNPFIACEITIPSPIPYGRNNTYEVFIKDNYAYLATRIGGLRIIDISDPYNAFHVETHYYRRNTHDVYVSGDYAYISSQYDDGLAIFDISSPVNPHWAGIYDAYLGITGLCARDSLIFVAADSFYIFEFAPALGSVSGTVLDADNNMPIGGATILAFPSAVSGVSGSAGEYIIENLHNFTYDLIFSHPNYFDTTVSDVHILEDDTIEVSVGMIHRPVVDAGVSGILDIPYPFVQGREYALKSEVNNYGYTAQSIYFVYEVYYSGSIYPEIADTIYISNMPGGSRDTLLFPTTFIPLPETTCILISYSVLAGDEDPTNDTTVMQVESIYDYYIFFGDPHGAPLEANIGSILEMTVWGATPLNLDQNGDGIVDSVLFMFIPLASPDSIISYRYPSWDPQDTLPAHSYFPFYPLNEWDAVTVEPEVIGSPEPGWTTQPMIGWAEVHGPYGDTPFFNSMADTMPLFIFAMQTAMDTTLLGQQLDPFQEGYYPGIGETFWGIQDGITTIYPAGYYSGLRFYSESELGYVMGTVTDTGGSPADDAVVSLLDAFREDTTDLSGDYYLPWITPGIYSLEFYHPDYGSAFVNDVEVWAGDTTVVDFQLIGGCEYLPGDANGDDNKNGVDVTYLVAYFKGGPRPPDQCDCPPHGIIYTAADADGSCATNGLDVTYMVSYFKGGPRILYCADCPPYE